MWTDVSTTITFKIMDGMYIVFVFKVTFSKIIYIFTLGSFNNFQPVQNLLFPSLIGLFTILLLKPAIKSIHDGQKSGMKDASRLGRAVLGVLRAVLTVTVDPRSESVTCAPGEDGGMKNAAKSGKNGRTKRCWNKQWNDRHHESCNDQPCRS